MFHYIILVFAAIGFLVVVSRIVTHFTPATTTNKFLKFIRLVAVGIESAESKTS